MEITDGEPDVVKFDTDLNEYIFMIVRLKVPKVVGVFVTTVQALHQEKISHPKIMLWIWLYQWAQKF